MTPRKPARVVQVSAARQESCLWLNSVWDSLQDKYASIDADQDDVVDLETLTIVRAGGFVSNLERRQIGSFEFERPQYTLEGDDDSEGQEASSAKRYTRIIDSDTSDSSEELSSNTATSDDEQEDDTLETITPTNNFSLKSLSTISPFKPSSICSQSTTTTQSTITPVASTSKIPYSPPLSRPVASSQLLLSDLSETESEKDLPPLRSPSTSPPLSSSPLKRNLAALQPWSSPNTLVKASPKSKTSTSSSPSPSKRRKLSPSSLSSNTSDSEAEIEKQLLVGRIPALIASDSIWKRSASEPDGRMEDSDEAISDVSPTTATLAANKSGLNFLVDDSEDDSFVDMEAEPPERNPRFKSPSKREKSVPTKDLNMKTEDEDVDFFSPASSALSTLQRQYQPPVSSLKRSVSPEKKWVISKTPLKGAVRPPMDHEEDSDDPIGL